MRLIVKIAAVAVLGLGPVTASLAVETVRLADRFALVGIISEDAPGQMGNGIVVLRDKLTKRTLTLHSGAALPHAGTLRVGEIHRKMVTLTDGVQTIELTYADLDTDAQPVLVPAPLPLRAVPHGLYIPSQEAPQAEALPRLKSMPEERTLPSGYVSPRASFPAEDGEFDDDMIDSEESDLWLSPH